MTNYILRISKKEWIPLVFGNRVYYTSMKRHWEENSKILFIKKSKEGDSIIGYGVIDSIISLEAMNGAEKEMCVEFGWAKKLIFRKMIRFEPPILINDRDISLWFKRNSLLHGKSISDDLFEDILNLHISE
ncbi:MAG: hypothetical protein QW416_03655 [Candidatus Nitrosocaldaceae archaeon]